MAGNGKRHILVVEDDPSITLGLQMNLEAEGYEVSIAVEGDDGRIDPGRHDAEGVPGGDEAVVRLQVLELAAQDADVRQPGEPLPERRAHLLVGVDQPETFEHRGASGSFWVVASSC